MVESGPHNTIHLFVWSLPDEPRIAATWEKKYVNYVVYPLTYAALVTARKLFSKDHYADIAELVEPAERKRLFAKAGELSQHMVDSLKDSSLPWAAATDYLQLINAAYAFLFWRALLKSARDKYGQGLILHFDFFSNDATPGQILRDYRLLDLAIDEANGWVKESRIRQVLNHVSKTCYALFKPVLKNVDFCLRTSDPQHSGQFDLVVLALEESDRRIQAPLINRLAKQDEISFKWITVKNGLMASSRDEKKLDEVFSIDRCAEFIPADLRVLSSFRFRFFKKAAHCTLAGEYASALSVFFADNTSSTVINRLAALLVKQHEHIKLYQSVRHVLGGKKFRALMMNSSYADMLAPQIWAEREGIPVLRLPHGAENIHGPAVQWKSRATGIFGKAGVEALKLNFGKDYNAVPVGALHFGIMASDNLKQDSGALFDEPFQVMMILSPGGTSNYPDTASDQERDLIAISSSVAAAGGSFLLRCHPRQVYSNYYDYKLMHRYFGVGEWNISDGSDSLVDAWRKSAVIITRVWSGASVQCLYGDKPMIAWMPRPGLASGDDMMRRLPCVVTSGPELKACLQRLSADAEFRCDVLKKQRELLAYYIEDPRGDAYQRAYDFTMSQVKALMS